jgi:Flp pilus assembly protein TadG
MFRENQFLLSSSLERRGTWVLRIADENFERFAFGCGAFSAAIWTIHSSFSRLPKTLVKKPQRRRLPKYKTTSQLLRQPFSLLRAADGAALIEFAVALPLLMVLIVGIFDFGGAFNLKQKLNNVAREGARFAASQPTNDLSGSNPPSVDAVRFLVDSYLQNAKINDCGLSTATWATGGGLSWQFSGTGPICSMTLTVSRGVAVQETVGGAQVNVLCTTVNIVHPYQWHFNNVIQLLVPGAKYTFTDLHSDATVVNMD